MPLKHNSQCFQVFLIKMVMATLGWMGAPESEVKMVEVMYEYTKGREEREREKREKNKRERRER